MKSLAQFRFVVNSFFPLFFAVIILPVHKQVIWWLVFRDIAGDPARGTKSTLHQTGGQVQPTMVLSLKKKNLILKSSEYVAYLVHSNIYKKNSFFQSYICIKKLNSSTNVKSMSFTEIDTCTTETFSFDRCSGTTCNVGERERWECSNTSHSAVWDPGVCVHQSSCDRIGNLRLQHAVQTHCPQIRPADVGGSVWGRVQNCPQSVRVVSTPQLV